MFDSLRPFLSRILASAIAAFGAYLTRKFGITLDAETQAGLISVSLFVFGLLYSVGHKLIDKKVNPGDAAAKSVAVVEKEQAVSLDVANARKTGIIP